MIDKEDIENIYNYFYNFIDDEIEDMNRYMNYASYYLFKGDIGIFRKFKEMARDEQKHAIYFYSILNNILKKENNEMDFGIFGFASLMPKYLNQKYHEDMRNNFSYSINGEIEAIHNYSNIISELEDFGIDLTDEEVELIEEIIRDENKHRNYLLSMIRQVKLF